MSERSSEEVWDAFDRAYWSPPGRWLWQWRRDRARRRETRLHPPTPPATILDALRAEGFTDDQIRGFAEQARR